MKYFNKDGEIIKSLKFNEHWKKTEKIIKGVMRRVYTYNENKNLIKVKTYTPEGQLIGTLRYLRDEEKG